MRFPVVGFLLFGCANLSSCERVHPKLSASVADSTIKSTKTNVEADLDALDAAVSVVDQHLVKTDTKKIQNQKSQEKKNVAKKAVKKSHRIHWVASKKPPTKMPEVDAQKSPMFQKEKNLVISKEAESVLIKGDARAHQKEEERHQKAVEKLAPANVVHVAAEMVQSDALADAKDLESDLHDLKQRIVADNKHQEEVAKQQAEEMAEKTAKKEKQGEEAMAKAAKPEKKADLNKLMKLSDEIKDDAQPASKSKASAVFLQLHSK